MESRKLTSFKVLGIVFAVFGLILAQSKPGFSQGTITAKWSYNFVPSIPQAKINPLNVQPIKLSSGDGLLVLVDEVSGVYLSDHNFYAYVLQNDGTVLSKNHLPTYAFGTAAPVIRPTIDFDGDSNGDILVLSKTGSATDIFDYNLLSSATGSVLKSKTNIPQKGGQASIQVAGDKMLALHTETKGIFPNPPTYTMFAESWDLANNFAVITGAPPTPGYGLQSTPIRIDGADSLAFSTISLMEVYDSNGLHKYNLPGGVYDSSRNTLFHSTDNAQAIDALNPSDGSLLSHYVMDPCAPVGGLLKAGTQAGRSSVIAITNGICPNTTPKIKKFDLTNNTVVWSIDFPVSGASGNNLPMVADINNDGQNDIVSLIYDPAMPGPFYNNIQINTGLDASVLQTIPINLSTYYYTPSLNNISFPGGSKGIVLLENEKVTVYGY